MTKAHGAHKSKQLAQGKELENLPKIKYLAPRTNERRVH